jgi:hypothetical protein
MMFNLTTESGAALTERWHDQALDLDSLTFDKPGRRCVFIVTEAKPEQSEKVKLLQNKQLQHCRVTIKNVARVQVLDAEGEAELYIDEVETSPTSLRVTAMNGTLEVLGDSLEVSLNATNAVGQTEVSFSTPIGEISWRRKQPKPPS